MEKIIQQRYQDWLEHTDLTEELKLLNQDEIEDCFYKNLEFGTGGMRGLMGPGTNRINKFTIMQATMALAKMIKTEAANNPSVVIAYDTRNDSEYFANCAAMVLASQGIHVQVFDQPTPTPVLSFAVRDLACQYGIVITASHNPKTYNGYKVYNAQGGQLLPNQAEQLIQMIDYDFPLEKLNTLVYDPDLIQSIDLNYRDRYMQALGGVSEDLADLDVVYSPLHGSGYKYVSKILASANLHIVHQQSTFDGNFPTVTLPNPEDVDALHEAVMLAQEVKADLVLATDPDCDRLGAVVRHQGDYLALSGNQIGALMIDYLAQKTDISNQIVVKTVVTSDLGIKIAESHGARIKNTLTGFKYIGQIINQLDSQGRADQFVFGYEESFGYLWGSHCRDKDAIISAYLISKIAKNYKQAGLTLVDRLQQLYQEYGYYFEDLDNFVFEGVSGEKRMASIMTNFRQFTEADLGFDFKKIDFQSGVEGLPSANLLKFVLSDGSWFAVRPSGTEPKLKIYYSIRAEQANQAEAKLEQIKASVSRRIYADEC